MSILYCFLIKTFFNTTNTIFVIFTEATTPTTSDLPSPEECQNDSDSINV